MNRTRTIVRTCSLLTVLMLVACARPSPLSSDPGSTSTIAMCGGGLDDGVTAAVEAEFERLSVRGITEFRRSVKAILNANDVSNEKYDRYIKCVLEIHRVRLEVESDHKEAEACKDRCTSLNDSCQANNRKMFDVCISRELKAAFVIARRSDFGLRANAMPVCATGPQCRNVPRSSTLSGASSRRNILNTRPNADPVTVSASPLVDPRTGFR